MSTVIGLGANLGSREAFLRAAVDLLDQPDTGVRVAATSSIYETEPVGPPQGRYLNAAVRVETALAPHPLLERLRQIESLLGRQRTVRYGPRTIDLDLLVMGDTRVDDAELTLPHPRLRERAFALAPLLDVAPDLAGSHGPALAALGGAPGPSWAFQRWPLHSEGSDQIHVEGRDPADVAAAAAWLLARTIAPLPPVGRTLTLPLPSGSEAPAVEAVVQALRQGFIPRHVLLPDVEAPSVLLLGAPSDQPGAWARVQLGSGWREDRFFVRCRLHPSE